MLKQIQFEAGGFSKPDSGILFAVVMRAEQHVWMTACLIHRNANAAMGVLLSKSMDDNLKKQQEFMLTNARLQVSESAPTRTSPLTSAVTSFSEKAKKKKSKFLIIFPTKKFYVHNLKLY